MNRLSKSLLSGLLEQENNITAFYGGGFKPPTKGHFLAAKKTLENYPDIDTLYIVVGSGIRDNISQDESISTWEIYKKYLPGDKVEIVKAKSPFTYIKDYIKKHTDHKSYVIIGSREDNDKDTEDFIKRKSFFEKYGDHVEIKNVVISGGISGTKAREAANTSKYDFFNFLPNELTDEEKNTIYNYIQSAIQEKKLKENKIEEILPKKFKAKLKDILKALKQEGRETKEAFSKIIKASKGEIELTDEDKKEIGNQLKDTLKLAGLASLAILPGGTIVAALLKVFKLDQHVLPSSFKKEKIEEILENVEESFDTFDYPKHIKSLTEFMLDLGLNIKPLPNVKFVNDDVENADNFFGKTAYYDPNQQRIVLYTLNRHPKDVMRSFAHEMIHHIQYLEDRLGDISTQNTNEDDHLDQIEREAYEKGNITFRNWTDSLNEGKGGADTAWTGDDNETITLQDVLELTKNIKIVNLPTKELATIVLNWDDNPEEIERISQVEISSQYPILIMVDDQNKIQWILDGNHRAQKALRAKSETIPAKLIKPSNLDSKARKILLGIVDEGKNKDPFGLNAYARELALGLEEEIVGKKIECDGCGWGWKIEDGGDDLYICHKCNHDNTPQNENIDPKSQSKHKGKSSPYGSAYEPLNEGRYDRITNKISSQVFNKWKSDIDLNIDSDEEQVSEYNFPVEEQGLKFDVMSRLILEPGIDGFETIDTTGAGTDKGGDFINIHLRINPELLPKFWGGISMTLKDIVRHEIEHLTHNLDAKSKKDVKTLPDDSVRRARIKSGELPQAEYFKLPKEIDANLQGMYFRAKKIKKPFDLVLNNYLDSQKFTPKEKEEILNLWRPRAKMLNLPPIK